MIGTGKFILLRGFLSAHCRHGYHHAPCVHAVQVLGRRAFVCAMSQFVLMMTRQAGKRKSPKHDIDTVRECLSKKLTQLGSHRHVVAALQTEKIAKEQEVAKVRRHIDATREVIVATCQEAKDLSLELNLLELELHQRNARHHSAAAATHVQGLRAHSRHDVLLQPIPSRHRLANSRSSNAGRVAVSRRMQQPAKQVRSVKPVVERTDELLVHSHTAEMAQLREIATKKII